jgi:hypothetical protein
MEYFKNLLGEMIPAVLAAVIAVMGAYIAVKEDVTTLTVNQEVMIKADKEYREDMKEVTREVQEHAVRIAVLEKD